MKITETVATTKATTTKASDEAITTPLSTTNTTKTPKTTETPSDDCEKKPTTCFEFIFEGFKLGALTYVILILSIKMAKLCAKIMGVGVVFCGLVGLLIGCLVAAAIVVYLVVDYNKSLKDFKEGQKDNLHSHWNDIIALYDNFCRECIPFLDE